MLSSDPRKRFRGGEFNLSEAGTGAQVSVTFAKDSIFYYGYKRLRDWHDGVRRAPALGNVHILYK